MTKVPTRNGIEQVWNAIRDLQRDAKKRQGSSSFLANATITKGGPVFKGPDGSQTRINDGVTEVRSDPAEAWVPLETAILDQVPPPSDGLPPASSPAVQLIPGIGVVFLKVAPVTNADPVTYDYYAGGGLVASSPATLVSVSALADGTPLPTNADTSFFVVARDADGAAASGTPASGRPLLVSSGDLAQSIIDDIDAVGAAASTALTTANGKNSNTFSGSATAPTTTDRAEGDVHTQITAGVAVKQWTLTAGAWAVRQIDGAVLTNVDAASITTGFLNVALLIQAGAIKADLIEAKSIGADQIAALAITSDLLAANSITANKLSSIITFSTLFRTAETGKRGEWDTDSLRFYNPAGDQTTRVAGDDAFFSGDAHFNNLETDSAVLGGVTTGAPGGRFRLATAVMDAPPLPLDHVSVPLARVSFTSGGTSAVFTDAAGTYRWRLKVGTDGATDLLRLSTAGALLDTKTLTVAGYPLRSPALSTDYLFLVGDSSIEARFRASSTTFTGRYTTSIPAAPGAGGYAAGEPIIGAQRTAANFLLVAHRVQGAQTIGGQTYADNEVMVRRYSASVIGLTLSLTLAQTIKTNLIAGGLLATVLMDNTSGTFDLPASAGNTAFALTTRSGGLGGFAADHYIRVTPNTGATVAAVDPTGAKAWYATSLGLFYDGTAFWSTDSSGDAIRKFGTSNVGATPVYHAYTYFKGAQETMLSPTFNTPLFARHQSQWTIPKLPAGITQVRIYESSVDGTRTRFERVGTFTGTSGAPLTVAQYPILPPAGSATNPPPATSDLANGAVYEIWDDFNNSWTGDGIVDLPGLVQITAQATGAATATAPFATGLTLTRIGNVVYPAGGFSRTTSFSGSFVTAGQIPDGFKPASAYADTNPFMGSTITWGVSIDTGGVVKIRMSAANTLNMSLNAPWITSDPMP